MSILVNEMIISEIKRYLKEHHSALYLSAFTNLEDREALKKAIKKKYGSSVSSEDKLGYVIQETVGLGVVDDIINKYPNVTDISFNGSHLIIETPFEKMKYDGEVNEDYIIKIIQKFANAVGKDFTPKTPILDAAFGNLRLNAVHRVNAPYGTTMAIRVTKPKLALTKNNFENFAPMYMYDFFKVAIQTGCNLVITGEPGTGKTELQKLLVDFIPFEDTVIWGEDTLEGHVKEIYPDKDIKSWITSESVSFIELIRASLRNNTHWLLISETRMKEAYEMIQSVLAGARIITSAHTIDARATPTRLVNMSKTGYQFDEDSLLDDIYRYFQWGIHIKKKKIDGKTVRFLSEVVGYLEGRKTHTVFKMKENGDQLVPTVGTLNEEFKERLIEHGLTYELPKKGEKEE